MTKIVRSPERRRRGRVGDLWLAVSGRLDARRGDNPAERAGARADTRRHRSRDSLLEHGAERRNPVARPPMRNVLLRPDAMPLRSGGTTPRPTRAMAGLAMPMPKPESSIPGMRTVQPELGPTASNAAMPAADMAMPPPSTAPGGSVLIGERKMNGTAKVRIVIGKRRSPPPSGE